jgi:hypothetical protein
MVCGEGRYLSGPELFLFPEICRFLFPATAAAPPPTIHSGPTLAAGSLTELLLAINQPSMIVVATLLSVCLVRLPSHREPRTHVGELKCITGMVVRVKQGARGVHFLDFCDDFRLCPFTVVIFPGDLKSVGDVRQLQGRVVDIHGQVKEYDGRAEIVLEEYRQLSGAGARNSSPAKELRRGKKARYSAGTFSQPKAKRKTTKRQPRDVITQAPEDPEQ